MPLILSIETATRVCAVALHHNGILVATQTLHIAHSHAESLHTTIAHLLSVSAYTQSDLAAIAVSSGPGSYTGLRLGIATAKGLCYTLGIPLIAIPTLAAMARGIQPYNTTQALLCPMIDARRMEVYCQLMDAQGWVLLEPCAMVIDEASFQQYLTQQLILFFGDGSAKCKPLLAHYANALFVDEVTPDAQHIGHLAQIKFQHGDFQDLASFAPTYLKPFGERKE